MSIKLWAVDRKKVKCLHNKTQTIYMRGEKKLLIM